MSKDLLIKCELKWLKLGSLFRYHQNSIVWCTKVEDIPDEKGRYMIKLSSLGTYPSKESGDVMVVPQDLSNIKDELEEPGE